MGMDKMQRLMRQHRIFALPMPGFMAKLDFELSMAFPYYMYFETNAQIDFNYDFRIPLYLHGSKENGGESKANAMPEPTGSVGIEGHVQLGAIPSVDQFFAGLGFGPACIGPYGQLSQSAYLGVDFFMTVSNGKNGFHEDMSLAEFDSISSMEKAGMCVHGATSLHTYFVDLDLYGDPKNSEGHEGECRAKGNGISFGIGFYALLPVPQGVFDIRIVPIWGRHDEGNVNMMTTVFDFKLQDAFDKLSEVEDDYGTKYMKAFFSSECWHSNQKGKSVLYSCKELTSKHLELALEQNDAQISPEVLAAAAALPRGSIVTIHAMQEVNDQITFISADETAGYQFRASADNLSTPENTASFLVETNGPSAEETYFKVMLKSEEKNCYLGLSNSENGMFGEDVYCGTDVQLECVNADAENAYTTQFIVEYLDDEDSSEEISFALFNRLDRGGKWYARYLTLADDGLLVVSDCVDLKFGTSREAWDPSTETKRKFKANVLSEPLGNICLPLETLVEVLSQEDE